MKDLQMYINGQFCNSSNGQWIAVLNPSTEEVISRQPEGTIEPRRLGPRNQPSSVLAIC
jgi:lactaldehyde dehydrogenase (EC 1.2.1.22)